MKAGTRRFALTVLFLSALAVYAGGQVRIAVSKTGETYEKWIHGADPNATIVNMYGMTVDSAVFVLYTCQGLLLTGGEDVNPAYYGKSNELSKCEEINHYRDTLEMALISRARLLRMPVFGICRGEQILNVALGGSLLTDIPADVGNAVIHRCPPGSPDCLHAVVIERNSELYRLTSIDKGIVNSFHHQAIDRVAPGYKVTAHSENGVAESIEREDPEGKSFIMGVQWHPERLDKNPSLALPLAGLFIKQVKDYRESRRNCCGAR